MLKTPPLIAVISERRFQVAILVILLVSLILVVRLWYIQIYRGDYYRRVSENNRMRRIETPAPRGLIYDRQGQLILGNRPAFDLIYIPQHGRDRKQVLSILSDLMHMPLAVLEKQILLAAGRPKFLPIILKRNLSQHEVSVVNINKLLLPGIDVRMSPQRSYDQELPSHLLGYLGKIDANTLKIYRRDYPDKLYLPGDFVGKQGLERRWEFFLRGVRGYEVIQVDAFGRKSSRLEPRLQLPQQPAIPGANLELTIDLDLQRSVARAFRGKRGAVVALDPRNGEVLAMLSTPQFDPKMYQQRITSRRWRRLLADPFHPLLDKTTGGEYPPGSIYKVVVALAALEERIITQQTKITCAGVFTLGRDTFRCHQRQGHGQVDLKTALVKSCDVFFYTIGVDLGVDRIARYAHKFGLGRKSGFNLNLERPGLIPTRKWKQQKHNKPWFQGETPNIAIGQGYNLLTPLQMASLYAAIVNGGILWQPYVVRRVSDHYGRIVKQQAQNVRKKITINPKHLKLIKNYLQAVVSDPEGTGHRAFRRNIPIGGKTGSIQVVSLKKYESQFDVSVKWREHAIFAAFTPVKKPELVVVVVSENDRVGGGGIAAAPVAAQIITAWWKNKKKTIARSR